MAACLQILYRPLQPPIQHPSPFPGSAHGFASTSGSIRPWMVWGRGGRRREADKRIALSSRNDIFDQHFHITPAEALSRASLRSLTLRFFSFFPPFHPPLPANFSSHSARLFLVPPDPFDSFHPFALTLFILALLLSIFSTSLLLPILSFLLPSFLLLLLLLLLDHRMASYPTPPLATERDYASKLRLGSARLLTVLYVDILITNPAVLYNRNLSVSIPPPRGRGSNRSDFLGLRGKGRGKIEGVVRASR